MVQVANLKSDSKEQNMLLCYNNSDKNQTIEIFPNINLMSKLSSAQQEILKKLSDLQKEYDEYQVQIELYETKLKNELSKIPNSFSDSVSTSAAKFRGFLNDTFGFNCNPTPGIEVAERNDKRERVNMHYKTLIAEAKTHQDVISRQMKIYQSKFYHQY